MSERSPNDEPVTAGRRLTRGRALALAAVVLLLAFLAGAATGVVVERRVLHPQWREARGGRGEGGRERRDEMRARLAKELGLDSAQSAKIDSIFRRHRPALDSVRESMESRLSSVVAQTRREIDSVLTPEQREKMHERWEHESREHRGPPPR
ncbi:MAG TPA: hypothetical protein VF761_01490 [Gemmatimonadaceae bacterium]